MTNPFLSITVVLWCLMALFLLQQWIEPIKSVPIGTRIFIFFLVTIAAPFLIISDIVMGFFDYIFPEGWNDDFCSKM